MVKNIKKSGFTIVEILVVIVVIGILATVSVVGYGSWRKTAAIAQVKSDLNAAASAMENARTFSNAYPTASLPNTVTASNGVTLSLFSGNMDGKSYCIDGASLSNSTVLYYIDSDTTVKGAQVGTCATRAGLPAPGTPSNLAVLSSMGTEVGLSWDVAANAVSYVAQCASDAAFVSGVKDVTVTHPTDTATVTGLTLSSTFYCRVKATNNKGSSPWSSRVSTTTNDTYGSLAVATSLDGYWTTAPQGFLLEDGSEVSRTTYAGLFAVIGTTFGVGDGSTTFNLPDSRGRASVNKNPSDTEFDTIGEKPGSKTETLTIAQMPSHTHTQNAHTHVQDAHAHGVSDPGHNHSQNGHTHGAGRSPNGDYIGAGGGGQGGWSLMVTSTNNIFQLIFTTVTATNNGAYTGISINATTATNQNTTATNQNTGGGGSHNNIQPSIVKTSAIKYTAVDTSVALLPAGTSIQGYWATAPEGYVLEDGTAYLRTDPVNTALFAAISTTYGVGDGSTTFNVPDSRGRIGVNKNTTDTEFDTLGEKPGSKTETLTIAQMPSHTHTQNAHTHVQNAHAHGVSDPGHNHSQNPHRHDARNSPNGDTIGMANGGEGGFGLQIGNQNNNIYRIIPSTTTATNNGAYTGIGIYNTTATNQNTTATNQNTGGGGSHNEIQPSIVKLSAIKRSAATSSVQPLAPATSLSGYWNAVTPPQGFLFEDGTAVSRTTYAGLFAVIGTTFGVGDGSTTFNLPDSRGRASVNKNPSDTEFDTIGEKPGSKTETLTIAQMPSHTHTQNAHTHVQNAHAHTIYDPGHNHTQNPHNHESRNSPDGNYVGMFGSTGGGWGIGNTDNNNTFRLILDFTTATNNGAYTGISINATTATNQNTTATNQNTGGGGSHNNIQPSIVKTYIIKT